MSVSKRKKSNYLTSLLAILIAVALIFIFFKKEKRKLYITGENVNGVTSEFSKTLPANYPRIAFADATTSSAIYFKHFYGQRSSQLPEDMGSGVAWLDYDRDGYDDLL